MSVMPVPGEPTSASQSCPNCGARLAEDQRYCLNCGRPCSPVRLAFLDVLQSEHTAPGGIGAGSGMRLGAPQLGAGDTQILPASPLMPPVLAYPAAAEAHDGVGGWLRRHAGVLSLISVLLVSGLIGLLIGHWVSGSSGPQTVKLVVPSGLSLGAPAAASTTPSGSAPAAAGAAAAHQPSKAHTAPKSEPVTEAEEEKETKEVESKPLATPKPTSHATLKKLESTTGKKHTEELEKNGTAPIETGG